MLTFYEWLTSLNEASGGRSKFGLYPPGYDGLGLYPLSYYLPDSADIITYIDRSDLHLYGYEGHPFNIKHIPGSPKPPKDQHLPGKVIPPKNNKMPGTIIPSKDTKMPGKIVRPTQWFKHPEFPQSDMDGNGGKVISA